MVEHGTELLDLLARLRQLADDHALVDLDRRHVVGGRQVDDDAVDLAVLEGLDRLVVGVEGGRLLASVWIWSAMAV